MASIREFTIFLSSGSNGTTYRMKVVEEEILQNQKHDFTAVLLAIHAIERHRKDALSRSKPPIDSSSTKQLVDC
jgi:hypothetical protein